MEQRMDYAKVSPDGYRAMQELDRYAKRSVLEPGLLELIKMRVPQINGCAYCLDMHGKVARARGETEALMRLRDGHVSDDVYQRASREFNPKDLVDPTLAVIVINGWNRLSIGFRTPAGTYRVEQR
jgi:AhpD family alkylhydroperoxidase